MSNLHAEEYKSFEEIKKTKENGIVDKCKFNMIKYKT